MIDAYIDFFANIGYPKGWVEKEEARKELSVKVKRVKWTPFHEWSKDTERGKIERKIEERMRNWVDVTVSERMRSWMLEVGCICAQEFTGEFYTLLLRVFEIVK